MVTSKRFVFSLVNNGSNGSLMVCKELYGRRKHNSVFFFSFAVCCWEFYGVVVNAGGLGDGDEDELLWKCGGSKLVVAHLCQEKIYPILLLLHKIQNFFICRYVHKVDFVYRVPYQPKRRMDMMNESRFMVHWFLHLPRKT
jgi:hypothetical protein